MTVAQAQRRFVLLTALRWLPVGMFAPVLVLLATSRGLSPVDVATAFAAQSAVVLAMELPTGGLADALGRRPVLLVSGALNLLAALLLAAAQDLPGFVLAIAVLGAGRALDSGPLEAWFVDAALLADSSVDPTPALSRAGAAEPAALALGVVLGGALPLLGGSTVLVVQVAAALTAVQVLAVAALVVEPRTRPGSPAGALAAGVADVPRTVREALRLLRRDPALRRLLVLAAGAGWVLSTVEVVGPLHLLEVTGAPEDAASAFSLVLFAGFGASALAAPLAGRARAAFRGAGRAVAALYAVGAVALLGWVVGGDEAVVVPAAVASAVVFYACNSASWPLQKAALHARVSGAQRTTTLSAVSVALQLGGVAAGFAGSALFAAVGPGAAFGLAAAVLLAAGACAVRLPGGVRA